MLKRGLILAVVVIVLVLVCDNGMAQCALCKASAENAKDDAAKGLNYAIMYLLIMPYILIAVIGYWWYVKNKKKTAGSGQTGEE